MVRTTIIMQSGSCSHSCCFDKWLKRFDGPKSLPELAHVW